MRVGWLGSQAKPSVGWDWKAKVTSPHDDSSENGASDLESTVESERSYNINNMLEDSSSDTDDDALADSCSFSHSLASLSVRLDNGVLKLDDETNHDPALEYGATTRPKRPKRPNGGFFADTPYFSAFIEKEVYSLEILTSTIKDIGSKTKAFGKIGMQMAEATRNLAVSCKLGPEADSSPEAIRVRRDTLGPELASSLEKLGKVLEEIAFAQEHMSYNFEHFLGQQLESISGAAQIETENLKSLKEESENETDSANQLFFRYINGKNAGGNLAGVGGGLGKNSVRGGSDHSDMMKAQKYAGWKHDMRSICVKNTTAELKRFRMARRIVHAKFEHNSELSAGLSQVLTKMKEYFSQSSSLVTKVASSVYEVEEKCRKHQVNHKGNDHPIWQQRENNFLNGLRRMELAEQNADRGVQRLAMEAKNIGRRDTRRREKRFDLTKIERRSGIWELPSAIASFSNFNRHRPPGVLVEGWLYQLTSSLLNPNNWSRAWFVLKRRGIYCLRSSAELRRQKKNNSFAKDKVCDVELCTIREIPENDDPSARFRFELIVPKYPKPIVLQAGGPKELKMWVDGIRNTISELLAVGDFKRRKSSDGLSNFNYNCQASDSKIFEISRPRGRLQRQSSEIKATVLDRSETLDLSETVGRDQNEEIESDDGIMGDDPPMSPVLKEIMDANPTCADCGLKSPDWVSLNLGVVMCLECSGVHRSLGVHVSKVRSLRLDRINARESGLLLALGNDRVNPFWEKEVGSQHGLSFMSTREVREEWIKRKYVKKEFTGFNDTSPDAIEHACLGLYLAAKKGDVVGVMKGLILGGRVDWKNEVDGGNTSLDVCGIDLDEGDDRAAQTFELLLQYGGKIKTVDNSIHWTRKRPNGGTGDSHQYSDYSSDDSSTDSSGADSFSDDSSDDDSSSSSSSSSSSEEETLAIL